MVTMSEYAKRRTELMKKMGNEAIAIILSAPEVYRNGDTTYPYRQNSDFYYLTGFDEPEAVLVLLPKHQQGEYILFNRVRDKDQEIWNGPRAGQEGAIKEFNADLAFPYEKFIPMLPDLLMGRKSVYYSLGASDEFNHILIEARNKLKNKIRSGVQLPLAFFDIATFLHEMRLIKSSAEIDMIQTAIDITQKGHCRAIKHCKPGKYEYELEAELLFEFQRHGARFTAYPCIVGAGSNSCVLHYVNNNKKIEDGDIVLIDAGAEYNNYASDITRCFPANGKFTSEQRAIYELVLNSQVAAIQSVKPGASWSKMQDIIIKIITQGLLDLKILRGDLDTLIEKQAYFPFYMHKSGHWLGLDVHDVGQYRLENKWRKLEPGMVFTVEPGIYVSADNKDVDKRWHNIGVRIEDNILVTDQGYKVLSENIPKKVHEIERLMAD